MSQDLFPDATGSPPALKLARERLQRLELAYAKAEQAMEDYGDPPPPVALIKEIAEAEAEVERLELQCVRSSNE